MKIISMLLIYMLFTLVCNGQGFDEDLVIIRENLEKVAEAKAKARLETDIDFINMPVKYADLYYNKGKPIKYTSDNFIVIPKRGLDFTWEELFRYEFMTVDRGNEMREGKTLKILNVIPLNDRADFAIMTLKLDTVNHHILAAEITTKNEGSFFIHFNYDQQVPFPSNVVVEFELKRIRIPLGYMGKDATVDKDGLKKDAMKKGEIFLTLDWEEMIIAD